LKTIFVIWFKLIRRQTRHLVAEKLRFHLLQLLQQRLQLRLQRLRLQQLLRRSDWLLRQLLRKKLRLQRSLEQLLSRQWESLYTVYIAYTPSRSPACALAFTVSRRSFALHALLALHSFDFWTFAPFIPPGISILFNFPHLTPCKHNQNIPLLIHCILNHKLEISHFISSPAFL